MRTVPVVGRCSAPTTFISVDLPEPDGPTMTTNSPCADREVDAVERRHRRRPGVVLGDRRPSSQHRPCARTPLTHGTTTWSPSATSPVISTMPSANAPSSTRDELRRRAVDAPRRRSRPRPGRASPRRARRARRRPTTTLDEHRRRVCRRGRSMRLVDGERRPAASSSPSLGGRGRADRGDGAGDRVAVGQLDRRPRRRRRSSSASVDVEVDVDDLLGAGHLDRRPRPPPARARRRRCRRAPVPGDDHELAERRSSPSSSWPWSAWNALTARGRGARPLLVDGDVVARWRSPRRSSTYSSCSDVACRRRRPGRGRATSARRRATASTGRPSTSTIDVAGLDELCRRAGSGSACRCRRARAVPPCRGRRFRRAPRCARGRWRPMATVFGAAASSGSSGDGAAWSTG